MKALKVTLDTNYLIYYLEKDKNYSSKVSKLIEMADKRKIDLAIVRTRTIADMNQDKDEIRRNRRLKEIERFKTISTASITFENFRFGNDFFADDEYIEKRDKIIEVMFGSLNRSDKHFHRKLCDVDHIMGHMDNKRDIFITNDRHFLKKRKILQKMFGIVVQTLDEFLKNMRK